MNKNNRIKDYLNDIIECCEKIEKYAATISFEDYCKDSKTIDGVERNIIKIGDIVERIPKEFQEKNSNIPWKEMRATRIKLTHHYPSINNETIWKTAKNDITSLKKVVETANSLTHEQNKKKVIPNQSAPNLV